MTVEVMDVGAVGLNLMLPVIPLTDDDLVTMHKCLKLSRDIFVGLVDGKIACVWGTVTPTVLSTRAGIWLYTTDLIKSNQFVFVRHSQLVVKSLLRDYESIEGDTDLHADHSKRWLKWLGAEFNYPPNGNRLGFVIRRK